MSKAQDAFAEALGLIRGGGVSCAVIRGGGIIHTDDGRGVSPLMRLYSGEPGKLAGSYIVDKIIGKAAAMILVLGGVEGAHGEVMSASAKAYLIERGIAAEHGLCVDMIADRTGRGMCPIERSVMDEDDPARGLAAIRETLASLANRTAQGPEEVRIG